MLLPDALREWASHLHGLRKLLNHAGGAFQEPSSMWERVMTQMEKEVLEFSRTFLRMEEKAQSRLERTSSSSGNVNPKSRRTSSSSNGNPMSRRASSSFSMNLNSRRTSSSSHASGGSSSLTRPLLWGRFTSDMEGEYSQTSSSPQLLKSLPELSSQASTDESSDYSTSSSRPSTPFDTPFRESLELEASSRCHPRSLDVPPAPTDANPCLSRPDLECPPLKPVQSWDSTISSIPEKPLPLPPSDSLHLRRRTDTTNVDSALYHRNGAQAHGSGECATPLTAVWIQSTS
ncbi:hypothetical protein FA95DRAFT_400498 [Auriscalpium vulgare]|uniref:Uncharacterized protein n=1 Tax=Auriscalpium vulgare TaxID=40419 RepID=A0ACB8RGT2_9AGAM|nr:hypothetical protein FA95DRAFT_400498 [Auriscalpium vulgare]